MTAFATAPLPRSRDDALAEDLADPLAAYRGAFRIDESGPIYLDGNSLGRQPEATAPAVGDLLAEWEHELIGGWQGWEQRLFAVGDEVARLLGARPGEVVISDSTTVNCYKLAVAALDARPGRARVLGDANDFPTVRYVLEGICASRGLRLELLENDPGEGLDEAQVAAALDEDVALVCVSGTNYRSGSTLDLGALCAAAHGAGALVLVDLSHTAGSVPVDLERAGVDLAVGCTYKYLNGGPGAPAWLYVRSALQTQLRQPIWGWWGQKDQFAMGPHYDPAPGIARFLTGSPTMLALAAVRAGIAPLLEVGMDTLWDKTRRLVALLARRVEERCVGLGARLASPSDPTRRGGHLAIAHEHAFSACRLLAERGLVIVDFRGPDVIRLAPVAISTRAVDVWDAIEHLAAVLADPAVREARPRTRFT
ncbi:MAG: aminotransferase class V-fold PLP-dependent enzyme [Actinomycetota bacterium]|nr:aminotransferase class V-fold PLP-dependent enzyme [Actinomycetota bacterium]